MTRRAGALVLAALVATPGVARGDDRAERVPLTESFPVSEQIAVYAIAALDIVLVVLQDDLVEAAGEPLIGRPNPLDEAISDALHRPGKGPWLERIPDLAGYVAPAVTFGWYGLDAAIQGIRGVSAAGTRQADHELLALLEGYALTLGLTQIVKLGVRRERPEIALRGRDPATDDEAYLSFWSGHSASSFMLAAFLTRDVGDYLANGPLADTPWLAYLGPGAGFYGAASLIALSRIIDQRHYFTDVLLGTTVGIAAGNLVYSLHFDGKGRPRRRSRVEVTAFPGGLGVSGVF